MCILMHVFAGVLQGDLPEHLGEYFQQLPAQVAGVASSCEGLWRLVNTYIDL